MKLDRNIHPHGEGKYALVKMRNRPKSGRAVTEVEAALITLHHHGVLDYGDTDENEFFVIRLKDRSAAPALAAYSNDAQQYDSEWAKETAALAAKAASHPSKRIPD